MNIHPAVRESENQTTNIQSCHNWLDETLGEDKDRSAENLKLRTESVVKSHSEIKGLLVGLLAAIAQTDVRTINHEVEDLGLEYVVQNTQENLETLYAQITSLHTKLKSK